MVNLKLGEEIRKDGMFSMSRAWDNEKRKVIGSIPVGDSDFFFVPRSRHAEYSIFSYNGYCLRRSQYGDPLLICKFTRQLSIPLGLFIINC